MTKDRDTKSLRTEEFDTPHGKAITTFSKNVEDLKADSMPQIDKEAFDNGKPCYLNLIRHYGGGRESSGSGIEFDMTSELIQPIVMAEDDDYIATYRVPTTSNKQITDFVFTMIDEARMTPNNRNSVRVIKKKLKKFKIPNPLVDDMPMNLEQVVDEDRQITYLKKSWNMEAIAKLRQQGKGHE